MDLFWRKAVLTQASQYVVKEKNTWYASSWQQRGVVYLFRVVSIST